jgi:hypothetical protein
MLRRPKHSKIEVLAPKEEKEEERVPLHFNWPLPQYDDEEKRYCLAENRIPITRPNVYINSPRIHSALAVTKLVHR